MAGLTANRELAATGPANIAGGFFDDVRGAPQTAVNQRGRAHQAAALVIAHSPSPHSRFSGRSRACRGPRRRGGSPYSVGLVKVGEFRAIRAVRTTEFRWAMIAFAGVLVLGTLRGILVAIVASLLTLMHQANNPPLHALGRKRGSDVFRARSGEHPTDETWPGLLILRPQGRVYFANAEHVGDKMWAMFDVAKPAVVLLDLGAVIDIEYTALTMLSEGGEAA
jgi:MFS superfamily sulfate permease-like transporter